MAPSPTRLIRHSLRRLARRRAVSIGLHGLGPRLPAMDPHGLWREPARFRADLELLLDAGFRFVTVAQLVEAAEGGAPPPGLAALSFDDGMQDNHDAALPILEELEVAATFYIPTGLLGERNPWLARETGARLMTEDELLTLHARGFELGAHTVTHADLRLLDYEACLSEVSASKASLERLTGAPVRTFAYPYCLYGPEAVRAVQDAGFAAAVTCDARGGWDPFRFRRSMLSTGDGPVALALKTADLYHPLLDSPPGRLARRARRAVRARRTR